MVDRWPGPAEVANLKLLYDMGLDNSCETREILQVFGGPAYWHISTCDCESPFDGWESAAASFF
jgi:hypothetical protein